MSLPPGCRVVLDPRRLTADGGRLLVGGSPLTALRLGTEVAARLADGHLQVTDGVSAEVAARLVATNIGSPDLDSLPQLLEAHDSGGLTVVVPVRDRADQLDRCLAALAPLRTVVVDDASLDPVRVAAVVRRHGGLLVSLAENSGPAAARNAGLTRVRTPYVAFVDSDVEAAGAALLRLSRHLADPDVALVGPRVEGRTRSSRSRWFERYDAAVSSLTLGHRPCRVQPGAYVAWLPGACLVGRTADLGTGFTASMRVGEDVDLVWRLVDLDRVVRYEPRVVVHHDVRPTLCSWLGRKAVYGSGGAVLGLRHGDRVAPAVLSPGMAAGAAALLMRRRWSLPVAAGVLACSTRQIHCALPGASLRPDRVRVAARLAVRGLGWAARQESALLVRHWWPAAAVACVVSPHARRAVVTAALVDTTVGLAEHQGRGAGPVALVAGRRLEDLAYGAGLWWGAWREHSTTCLRPRRPGRPGHAGPAAVAPTDADEVIA